MSRLILVLCLTLPGCRAALEASTAIPDPAASAGGAVVVNVDVGRTQMPRLVFEGADGYRRATIEEPGPVVVHLPPGQWTLQVVGVPYDADPTHVGGLTGALERSFWPEDPIPIEIRAGHLTNAGTICLHRDCAPEVAPFDHPDLDPWRAAGRLITVPRKHRASSIL